MSASRKATAWCSAIGFPNCSRVLRVVDRILERCAREAGRRSTEHDARRVERAHEAEKPCALLAQAAILRDEAVLQENLGSSRSRAGPSSCIGGPKVRPLVPLLEHEGRDALEPRAGRDRREDDVVLGRRRRWRSSSSARAGRTRRRPASRSSSSRPRRSRRPARSLAIAPSGGAGAERLDPAPLLLLGAERRGPASRRSRWT